MRPMLKACLPCGRPQPVDDLLDRRRVHVRVSLEQLVDDEGAQSRRGAAVASDPLKARPIGVRTASTITASGMGYRCS